MAQKPTKPSTRKITVTASSSAAPKTSNKTVKAGSMAGNAKLAPDNRAAKKAATSYSPKRMSANDKRAAGFAGAKTQLQISFRQRDAAEKAAKAKKASYSPAPMSAAAKAKTRVAAAKKQPSLTSKVVNRAKTVAREVRDIPTAVGTVVRATAAGKPKPGTNTPPNKQAMYAKYDLKKQIKQVGDAVKSGKTGTPAVRYGKDKPKR